MPIRRMGGKLVKPRVQVKPPGTRCYVPGYADDATQFAIDQSQLGIAPLAIASTAVSTGKVLGISFKKSPRYMGGPLLSTVAGKMNQIATGDTGVIRELHNLSKGIGTSREHTAGWRGVWQNEVPKQRLTSAQYELVKQLDPSLPVMAPAAAPGAPAIAPPVSYAPPPPPPPSGVTPPSVPTIGPITVTLPGAPAPQYLPAPPSTLPGGESPVPESVAHPPIQQAGMFGGDMSKMLIPGLILLAVTVLGKKGR